MRCPTLRDLPPPPAEKKGWPWTEESTILPDSTPDGASWPKITIVTPSLNQGSFIEETIRSALLQGYPDIELIIMDGGSSDNSVEIIKKYEQWISFWESGEDNGQASAINKGWLKAEGEIVSYLNSDDTLVKDALIVVSGRFKKNNNLGMVFGDAVFVNNRGIPLMKFRGGEFRQPDLLFRFLNIAQPAAFYKLSVLKETGFLNEELHYSMDFDLWLRISLRHSVDYIPILLATMRLHSGAKTVQAFQSFYLDELKSIRMIFQQQNIAENLKTLEEEAYARCYLRGGYRNFQLGKMSDARHLLLSALKQYPRFLLNPLHILIFLMTVLPPQVIRTLYQMKSCLTHRKNFVDLVLESNE